ncbi:MAG: rhomboid family intramembrane serine protease, partial [Bacteroidota bacterium]
MYTTYIIIGVTVGITLMAFNNYDLFLRLKHWPWQERKNNEFHRWVTCGFLHANQMHLIFNMISLYFFGELVESWFFGRFGQGGASMYVLYYLAATAAASSATYFKYRNSPSFASVGASGAVAA